MQVSFIFNQFEFCELFWDSWELLNWNKDKIYFFEHLIKVHSNLIVAYHHFQLITHSKEHFGDTNFDSHA